MITCPFCSTEIDDGLSRFGGNCPHCFNVIPGEEAPTDPGVAAAPVVATSSEAAGGSKMILVFGFLAFVAVAAAVGIGRKDSADSEEQAQNEMEMQVEEDLKTKEKERLAVLAADEEQAAEEKAAEAAALEEKEAAEVAARERARAAALAKTRASERSAASTPSVKSVELPVVSAPISTSPTREVVSGVLETPVEINGAIRNSLRRYKGQLEQCYNIELNENEGLKGRWEVSFTVEATGKTSSVSVRGVTGSHADLEACMLKNVKRWSFPRIVEAYPYVKEYTFGR
jgi:hypothetical protein